MHLDGLDLSGESSWGKCDHHTRLDDPGLNSPHGNCSNTANLVHVLEWQSQGLVGWSLGWDYRVKGLEQCGSAGFSLLPLNSPSLVHVLEWQSQGLVSWSLGWDYRVKGLEQCGS